MAKDFGETTLVVVEALFGFVVDGTDVNDDVARVQDGRIASTF